MEKRAYVPGTVVRLLPVPARACYQYTFPGNAFTTTTVRLLHQYCNNHREHLQASRSSSMYSFPEGIFTAAAIVVHLSLAQEGA